MKSKIFCLILTLLMLSGCATRTTWMATGAGVGAVNGAIVGAAVTKTGKKNASAVGAAIGALAGILIGQVVHKRLEKRDDRVRQDVLFNLEKFGVTSEGEQLKIIRPAAGCQKKDQK